MELLKVLTSCTAWFRRICEVEQLVQTVFYIASCVTPAMLTTEHDIDMILFLLCLLCHPVMGKGPARAATADDSFVRVMAISAYVDLLLSPGVMFASAVFGYPMQLFERRLHACPNNKLDEHNQEGDVTFVARPMPWRCLEIPAIRTPFVVFYLSMVCSDAESFPFAIPYINRVAQTLIRTTTVVKVKAVMLECPCALRRGFVRACLNILRKSDLRTIPDAVFFDDVTVTMEDTAWLGEAATLPAVLASVVDEHNALSIDWVRLAAMGQDDDDQDAFWTRVWDWFQKVHPALPSALMDHLACSLDAQVAFSKHILTKCSSIEHVLDLAVMYPEHILAHPIAQDCLRALSSCCWRKQVLRHCVPAMNTQWIGYLLKRVRDDEEFVSALNRARRIAELEARREDIRKQREQVLRRRDQLMQEEKALRRVLDE
jgi:hypothetical protein